MSEANGVPGGGLAPAAPRPQPDPSRVLTPCEVEGCRIVKPLGQMYSLALVWRMPGLSLAPFQCAAEQHFGCSPEHAEAAALACLEQHLRPAHRALHNEAMARK